jgi:hypothetical protein
VFSLHNKHLREYIYIYIHTVQFFLTSSFKLNLDRRETSLCPMISHNEVSNKKSAPLDYVLKHLHEVFLKLEIGREHPGT